MSKEDVTRKLAKTEASLRRWQSRLKRAATMVHDLDRKRRRYQLMLLSEGQPVIATVKVKKLGPNFTEPFTDPVIETKAALVQAVDDRLTQIIEGKPADDLSIPVFMARSLKQKVSDEERTKMPLSGREAEKFLKEQSAKVTKRRAKKELPPRPKK